MRYIRGSQISVCIIAVTCDQYRDLMPAYLLGMLDSEETEPLLGHVQSGCPRCAGALAETDSALSLLPLALTPITPPPRIRKQLLARISAPAASAGAFRPSAPHFRRRTVLPWSVGIAASIVAVGVGLWALQEQRATVGLQSNVADLQNRLGAEHGQVQHMQTIVQAQDARLRQMKSRPIQVASLLGTPTDAKATAHVFFDSKNSSIAIIAAGFSPLPDSKTYELWLIPAGKNPIPAGTFAVDAQGNGFLETKVSQFADATAAAITAEPAGGSQVPTLPIRVIGKIEPIPD
jgi:hypothetical protein